jgi:hypothetical protein
MSFDFSSTFQVDEYQHFVYKSLNFLLQVTLFHVSAAKCWCDNVQVALQIETRYRSHLETESKGT